MPSSPARLLIALGAAVLAWGLFQAAPPTPEVVTASAGPLLAASPRPEALKPTRAPTGPAERWRVELDTLSRLPGGTGREARFERLLAQTAPEDYPGLGDRIARCSAGADWRAEAGRFVTVWCGRTPLEATAWLLQHGSRLDTTTAAQAVRTLALANPGELSLLLDFAPPDWSRDCLLAAAAETYADQSQEAALRWLSRLPREAEYRETAVQAVAGAFCRRGGEARSPADNF